MTRLWAMHQAAIEGDVRGVITWPRDNPDMNPDVVDPNGYTPLFLACGNGHSSVAKVLLRAGADANCKCLEHEITSLHAVGRMEHYHMF